MLGGLDLPAEGEERSIMHQEQWQLGSTAWQTLELAWLPVLDPRAVELPVLLRMLLRCFCNGILKKIKSFYFYGCLWA